MKKLTKRLLSLALVVVMVFGMVPQSVAASDTSTPEAPFTAITTADGGEVSAKYVDTVSAATEWATYNDAPYYLVTVPEGTESVKVTYPADISIAGSPTAYSYTLEVPGYGLGYGSENFEVETNDDGSNTVTIPIANYLLDEDGKGTAISLENGNGTFDPITFFAFQYGEEQKDNLTYTMYLRSGSSGNYEYLDTSVFGEKGVVLDRSTYSPWPNNASLVVKDSNGNNVEAKWTIDNENAAKLQDRSTYTDYEQGLIRVSCMGSNRCEYGIVTATLEDGTTLTLKVTNINFPTTVYYTGVESEDGVGYYGSYSDSHAYGAPGDEFTPVYVLRNGNTPLIEPELNYLTLKLNSDNEDVVKIENGKAKIVGEGTAKVWLSVTAPYDGLDKEYGNKLVNGFEFRAITVHADKGYLKNVTFADEEGKSIDSLEVSENKTATAKLVFNPEDAYTYGIMASSENEEVAKVKLTDKMLTVTGVSEGTTTVKVNYGPSSTNYTKVVKIPVTVTKGHEHSYTSVVTKPTCTEQGYTTYTCECGYSYKDDYTDATGHHYEDGVCTECGAKDPSSTDVPSVTVYFSFSHDDKFETCEESGAVMGLKKVTVPYFDLANYGLENFYFSSEEYGSDGSYEGVGAPGSDLMPGTAEFAYGKITMLHLFIYATEVYYCGVDPSEAGQGYLCEAGIMGSDVFNISGSTGSSFLNNIWNYDLNLNYYLNYEYPLASEGWGSTSDQILLHDGDIVTLGHFTSWSFFGDPSSIFNYIKADKSEAEQGEKINLTLYHAGADMMGDYSTAHTKIDYCPDVYYVNVDDMTTGDVTDESVWTHIGTAKADGTITLDTTELEPGTYMVAMAGQYGTDYTDEICSTPGGVLVTVKEKIFSVQLDDNLSGASEIKTGEDYTFTVKEAANYDYVTAATVGGKLVMPRDNKDGTYTIENVDGDLVIKAVRTPKNYRVTVDGAGKADTTADGKATYNEDYSFNVVEDSAYTYEVSATIAGKEYTFEEPVDGTYTISGEDVTGDIEINVTKTKKPVDVSNIKITGISKKIVAGKKVQLSATVTPSNASNKSVKWESSNKKVATVNSKGLVTMKAKTGGKTVTIYAYAKDGSGVKASYKITSMKGIVKSIKISGAKSVKNGKTLKLKATVSATKGANKTLTWKSSNTKYATVKNGKVTTYKAGKGKKVTITAMATDGSNQKKSVKISIK